MSSGSVITGLDQATTAAVLGAEAWSRLAARWRDFREVLASQSEDAEAIVWLYRSPGTSLFDTGQDVEEALREWSQLSRAALNLRMVRPERVRLLDVDCIEGLSLADTLDGTGVLSHKVKGKDEVQDAFVQVVYVLFPDIKETHGMLEGAAWGGDPSVLSAVCLPGEAIGQLAATLRSVRVGNAEVATRSDKDRDEAVQRQRALMAEVDSLKARVAEQSRFSARVEKDLTFQLNRSQEELEQYYLAGLAKDKELSEVRSDLGEAEGEIRALRLQLGYLQEELRGRPAIAPITPSMALRLKARVGRLLGRGSPSSSVAERTRAVDELRASRWFDEQWYLSQYPDVAAAGMDPVAHYFDYGASEGRDPGPRFSTNFYLESNQDVAQANTNPLLHFIRHGLGEGRFPCPGGQMPRYGPDRK